MLFANLLYAMPMVRGLYTNDLTIINIDYDYMIISIVMIFLTFILLLFSIYYIRRFSKSPTVLDADKNIFNSIKVLDNIPIGIMMVNLEGNIKYINREAGQIIEQETSVLLNKPMIKFFPNNYYHYTMEVINTGREYLSLRNIIKVKSFFKELLFNISPLTDGNLTLGAIATFQDVTPQQKMLEVHSAYTLTKDLVLQKDLNSTVDTIVKAVAEMCTIEWTAIFLADQEGNLMIQAVNGIPTEVVQRYNAAPFHVFSQEIMDIYRNKQPLLHGNVGKTDKIKKLMILPDIESFYSFPIFYEGKLIGLLNLYSRIKDKLSRDLIYLMQSLSEQINAAIINFYEFQRVKSLASVDGLTGLFNKTFFMETISSIATQLINTAGSKSPLSLAILDIDHFKAINDSYGHQSGDLVLQKVAAIISKSVRKSDVVCRYGGEEFSIIMPAVSKENAIIAVDRIKSEIADTIFFSTQKKQLKITVSGGVSSCPEDTSTVDQLILYSDTALYTAKMSGRNKIVGYNPSENSPFQKS